MADFGGIGEIKDVKDGYGRNYLIPKKYALLANDPQAQKFILERNARKHQQKEKQEEKRNEIKSLNDTKVIFKVKANPKNESYEAVTAKDIAQRLNIDSKYIEIKPIKKIGETKIKINVDGLVSEIKIVLEVEKRYTYKWRGNESK